MQISTAVAVIGGLLFAAGGGAGVGYLVSESSNSEASETVVSSVTETDIETVTATETEQAQAVSEPEPLEPTTTQEGEGLLGFEVIDDLLAQGLINGYDVVPPKPGWDTQFRLDSAGGVVRFREGRSSSALGGLRKVTAS